MVGLLKRLQRPMDNFGLLHSLLIRALLKYTLENELFREGQRLSKNALL